VDFAGVSFDMICSDFLKEIYSRKNLIRELVTKELKVRYSRPLLGFFWAFLSPVLTVIVFYVIFSLFLKVRIEESPFILYLMSAVFPWRFFTDSLMASTSSLVDNKSLIRESNFPHYVIPISISLANLVNFLPSLAILLISSAVMLKGLPIFLIILPFVLLIHLFITIGLSIILSILYVRWRDIKYVLDSFLLFLFYIIPGVYQFSYVKESLSPSLFTAYTYNPLVGLLSLYRISVLKGYYQGIGSNMTQGALIFVPLIFSFGIFWAGLIYYRRNRTGINDYLNY